jgi:hypothetical protein
VLAHDLPLPLVELAGLVEDLVRHPDLPDVVQQCTGPDLLDLLPAQPQRVTNPRRQVDNALRMLTGVAVALLERSATLSDLP